MKKIIYSVILTIVVVSVAYIAGTEAGNYFQKQKIVENEKQIAEKIISQMNDVKVGDKIQDYAFENLKFESVMLRPLIKEKTILFFIQPDCPSCIVDMERLSNYIKTKQNASQFIIISSGNPRQLMEMRDEFSIKSPILYDHERGYSSIFGIFTYPFHIVIDKDMRIVEIIAVPLKDGDIQKLLE